ncbi:hypothetical protein DFA_06403 [Cavenderia fasciculata]|uniref:EGF-like domain-containing protein n=1 Tax=Cavenderia fasciculata TaxID=261658 RepID=F4PIW7_CACFS|nr:uncharacterized protein DFA_06403 [Cavenderia fasciculata]EGG24253.1 hypothetical protein DFA_06403 [Cavenderia fasciculata]|eukprot:XP_004362104.1 hypothetical protein DFA_06403 [Cavenderia fasciculata]
MLLSKRGVNILFICTFVLLLLYVTVVTSITSLLTAQVYVLPADIYGAPAFDGQNCYSTYKAQTFGSVAPMSVMSDVVSSSGAQSCRAVGSVGVQCDVDLLFMYPPADGPQDYTVTFASGVGGDTPFDLTVTLDCALPQYQQPTLLSAYSNLTSIIVSFKGDRYSRTLKGQNTNLTPYQLSMNQPNCYVFSIGPNVTKGSTRFDTHTYTFVVSALIDASKAGLCDYTVPVVVTVWNLFAPTTVRTTFTLPTLPSAVSTTSTFVAGQDYTRVMVRQEPKAFNGFVTHTTSLVTVRGGVNVNGSQMLVCTIPSGIEPYPVDAFKVLSFPVLGNPVKLSTTYLQVDPITQSLSAGASPLIFVNAHTSTNQSDISATIVKTTNTLQVGSIIPGQGSTADPLLLQLTFYISSLVPVPIYFTSNFASRFSYAVAPPVPYGITNGDISFNNWNVRFLLPKYYSSSSETFQLSQLSATDYKQQLSTFTLTPTVTVEANKPLISSTNIKLISNNRIWISVEASDEESGVLGITCGFVIVQSNPIAAVVLDESNLVSGSIYNGVWQGYLDLDGKYKDFVLSSFKCVAVDQALNQGLFAVGTFLPSATGSFNRFALPPLDMLWLAEDFTYFQFKYSSVDVTNVEVKNTLWFKVVEKPGIQLSQVRPVLSIKSFRTARSSQELSFEGLWNPDLQLFQIDFIVPMNIYQGYLKYTIKSFPDIHFTNFLSQFPQNASLYVISNYGDLYPPMITNVSVGFTQNGLDLDVEWLVTIKDQPNGLDYAVINITSNKDWIPRTFVLRPVNVTVGDAYIGTYSIKYTTRCLDEIYTMSSAMTKDRSYNYGMSPTYNLPIGTPLVEQPNLNYINPLEGITTNSLRGVFTCTPPTVVPPLTTPLISNFVLSDTVFYAYRPALNYTVSFTVNDTTGISYRHTPYLFIQSLHGAHLQIPTIMSTSSSKTIAYYSATFNIPFGFGHSMDATSSYPFAVSVFGATNVMMRSGSYIQSELVPRDTTLPQPLVTSYYPSIVYNNGGFNLTLHLKTLGAGIIVGNCLVGSQTLVHSAVTASTVTFTLANGPTVTLPLPPTITCFAAVNGILSNKVVIPTVAPVYTPPSTGGGGSDPGNGNGNGTNQHACYQSGCSNNGNCTNNGCVCNLGFSGTLCDKVVIKVPTNVSETSPETTSQEDKKLKSIISIVGVRELGLDGTIIHNYQFTDGWNWTWTNQSASNSTGAPPAMYNTFSGDSKINQYTTVITPDRKTKLSIVIEQFNDLGVVGFANQNLTMQPGTVKYFIAMDTYQFENALNTLQLILSINVESLGGDNECGTSIDFGSDSSSNPTDKNSLNWIKFKIEDRVLYGRFINTGIVDYRIVRVSNSLLENDNKSSTSTLVALNIPNYSNQIYLDPDFSYLIDAKDECSSSSGLTTAHIIGIAIGGAAVLLIATLAVLSRDRDNEMKEDIASFLLSKGYYLTALEFYQELLEDDGTEIESLKNYFQSNFNTDNQQDPIRIVRDRKKTGQSSINDKPKDEKISLLEYELRQSREEIIKLKDQLKKQQQYNNSSSNNGSNNNNGQQSTSPKQSSKNGNNGLIDNNNDPHSQQSQQAYQNMNKEDKSSLDSRAKEKIKPHEKKILNHLFKNYLIANGYSFTAVSFSEENQDDSRSWNDLGLNQAEPPALLTIYRYFFESGDSGVQGVLTKTMGEITKLKKELTENENNWRESKKKVQTLQKEKDDLLTVLKDYEKRMEDIKQRNALGASTSGMTMMSPPLSSATLTSTTTTTGTKSITMSDSNTNKKKQQDVAREQRQQMIDKLSVMRKTFRGLVEKRRQTVAFSIVSNDDESDASVRIAEEVEQLKLVDGDNAIRMVCLISDWLPHILPAMYPNRREELIPLILVIISNHPDETTRFALTKMLFNLTKKPDEFQRHVIMKGCMALASMVGPLRTETEILAQCWEQLTEKYPERRVLVADSCGSLAQFASAELRLSLILSILQQLGQDKSALVRSAVAKNFALLINFFETDDKYNQVEESFKALLYDDDQTVSHAARNFFLPSLANWTDLLESLNTKLIQFLLSEMLSTVVKYSNQREEYKIPEQDVLKIENLLNCFNDIIPRIHQSIISSSPFINEKDAKSIEGECDKQEAIYQYQYKSSTSTSSDKPSTSSNNNNQEASSSSSSSSSATTQSTNNSNQTTSSINATIRISILGSPEVTKLNAQMDQYLLTLVSNDLSMSGWTSLEWIANDFVGKLVRILYCIPVGNTKLISMFSRSLYLFSSTFGPIFTKRILKTSFYREFQRDDLSSSNNNSKSSGAITASAGSPNIPIKKYRLLSLFTAGVLHSLESSELSSFLVDLIVQISMEEKGWDHSSIPALVKTIELLCSNNVDRKKEVSEALATLTANPSNQVRSCILNLYKVIIHLFTPQQISNSIIPSLVTMSTDPDRPVRFVCIGALSMALSQVTDDNVLEKIAIAIERILEDKHHMLEVEFVKLMTSIIPIVKPRFRDSFVLPKIIEFVRKNNHNPSHDNRKEMSQQLFDCVRSFVSTQAFPKEFLQEQILPTLKLLLNDAPLHDSSFKSMVLTMISEIETMIKEDMRNQMKRASSKSSGIEAPNLPNLSNIGLPKWGWKKDPSK